MEETIVRSADVRFGGSAYTHTLTALIENFLIAAPEWRKTKI